MSRHPRPHRTLTVRYSPRQYLQLANMLAQRQSQDLPLRTLAADICRGVLSIPNDAPLALATWIREHVQYVQESGEIICGPYHTLPRMRVGPWVIGGGGVGDCDDLATTWATLVRALGLEAFVVGVGPREAKSYAHAMGYCNGRFYELTDCSRYGCKPTTAMGVAVPRDWAADAYDPVLREWRDLSAELAVAPSARGSAVMNGYHPVGRWYVMRGVGESAEAADEYFRQGGIDLSDIAGAEGAPGALRAGARAITTAGAAAGSALAITSAIGVSVPGIGPIVAGAALIGIGIGALVKAGKLRRQTLRKGLAVRALVDALVDIMRIEDPVDRRWVTLRVLELVPKMANTGQQIASYENEIARRPARWVNGKTNHWKRGVAKKVRGARRQAAVLQQHAGVLETFARSLAARPVAERRGALRLAIEQYLGADAIAGRVGEVLPAWTPTGDSADAPARAKKLNPAWLLLPAAAAAAFLLS